MDFDGKEVAQEFEDVFFGKKITDLTERQLWWLTKVIKHCRMRCRNNSALNNYMNRNFPHATFREVTKTKDNGETYQGLEIKVKEMKQE